MWLEQSRELHEKLREFSDQGEFQGQVDLLNEARAFHEKFQQQFSDMNSEDGRHLLSVARSLQQDLVWGQAAVGVKTSFFVFLKALKRSFIFRYPNATRALQPAYRRFLGR